MLTEKCHKAFILSNLYTETNYNYLLFLKPILEEMDRINKNFQSQKTNPVKLLGDLTYGINYLGTKVIAPDSQINILEDNFEENVKRDLYLGYEFEANLKKNKNKIDDETELSIRQHCTDFVIKLITQLKQRLPNFQILKNIDLFSIENVLRANKKPIVSILELFASHDIDIEKITAQYNTINLVQWTNKENIVPFWAEVNEYKDAAGNKPFSNLASFVITLLSLPWSNAEVERVFSQANLVKTKLRNRMHIETLNSILAIRYGLRQNGACCHNYQVPDSVVRLIGTNAVYAVDNQEENSSLDEILDVLNENN